jgi:hypothetical protein
MFSHLPVLHYSSIFQTEMGIQLLHKLTSLKTVGGDFSLPPTFSAPGPLQTPLSQHDLLLTSSPDASFLPDTFSNTGDLNELTTASQLFAPTQPGNSKAGLFAAYYLYFHSAHPFLLPHAQLLGQLENPRISHLSLAIQYVGSLYVSEAPSAMHLEALHQTLAYSDIPRDGYLVQTRLLMAVGLHIDDQEELSASMMYSAISLAKELGMHRKNYAADNGGQFGRLAETWRRTWWEAFVLDGLFAGSNPSYTLQLFEIATDAYLPSDDSDLARESYRPLCLQIIC